MSGYYVYHCSDGVVRTNMRLSWLQALLHGDHSPKPPEWWLNSQEREEGRSRAQASIIWARHYKPARKYLIWSQAGDDDFRRLGYLEG